VIDIAKGVQGVVKTPPARRPPPFSPWQTLFTLVIDGINLDVRVGGAPIGGADFP
jgi:hypothetical protein